MSALGPRREKLLDLLVAVLPAAGQVEVHAVLHRLRIGDRHEAHADGHALVGPDADVVLTLGQDLPTGCLRPELGQPRQVVSAATMRWSPTGMLSVRAGAQGCVPLTRPSFAEGIRLGSRRARIALQLLSGR